MGLKPLTEIQALLRSTTADGFAGRHPDQDLILIEPYEKGREYSGQTEVHAQAQVMFLPRVVGTPVSVGRDSRASLMLDHPAVSRLHLVVAYTDQGWKAMDRSSNGSWLDGERMPSQQPVPMGYGVPLRLGRAVIARMFELEPFHAYASAAGAGRPPPSTPPQAIPQDRTADTWRIPVSSLRPNTKEFAKPVAEPAPNPPQNDVEFDIEFGDAPAPAPPPPPAPPRAPTPPKPAPAAPPPATKVRGDGLEFEFDFDFEGDGRGGFA